MFNFKRIGALALAIAMCMSSFASAGTGKYLALGNDLSGEEQLTVLKLLGAEDLDDYNVIYVTNEDEHKYLDSYVSASAIGNKSLSSVLIEDKMGSSIDVETYNINYCTEGMYRNALATAGVKGAKVVVAGPYDISGTAALVGTIKLYEEMTGEEVDDEVIEASVEELTTTGELGEELGDKGAIEEIIAGVKQELAENPNMSDDDLIQKIKEAAEKAGLTLTDAQIQKIKEMLQTLQGLDIDWSNVKEQSSSLLKDIGSLIDTDQAKGFFAQLVEWIKSFF